MIRLIQVRRRVPFFEQLETRCVPADLTVPLDPLLDQFGDQIGAYQSYGDGSNATDSIFDTGASALTFSSDDQDGMQIPIKVSGGAVAGGVGGEISGDVGAAGTIYADGLHAIDMSGLFDGDLTSLDGSLDTTTAAATSGIQPFIGTASGSPDLPTITGTPMLNPSSFNPAGLAAKIDMQGYSFDLLGGLEDYLPEFSDSELSFQMPDLHFVAPGTAPAGADDTTAPVYVPLSFFGGDNHTDPGDDITESPSPMQPNVSLVYQDSTPALSNQHFLLDTGAQLSILSTATAEALGIDLSHPETTMTVSGVGGSVDVPGYTLKQLQLPTTDGGTITFTDVPVYVLDVDPSLDGILGMNLFDTANSMVYDPFNPDGSRLGLTFHTTPRDADTGDDLSGLLGDLNSLSDFMNADQMQSFNFFAGMMTGHSLPGFNFGASTPTDVATTTALTATPNASTGGTLVTLTATVAPSPGVLGNVNFLDNGAVLPGGSNVALVGGVATFQISNLSAGHHPISAAYSGATGYLASTSTPIDVAIDAPAPKIVSVAVNGDQSNLAASSDSRVVSAVVTFDRAVELDANAVSLALHTNDVVYNGVAQPNGMGTLPTTVTLTPSGDKKTWTATFSGNTDDGADGLKSLKDGVYDLNVNGANVHPLGVSGVSMAGNSTTTFDRLFGDSNSAATPSGGTSGVDYQAILSSADNLAFRTAFGNPAGYKSSFDFNGDGVINTADNLQFRLRFNQSLTWRV